MASVFVLTHRKDGHVLGVCWDGRAVQERIRYLEDERAIFAADDVCVDSYEVLT